MAKKQLKRKDPHEQLKFKLSFYLSKGISLDDARVLCNCSKDTLNRVRRDPDFEDFIQRCKAENEEMHIDTITKASLNGNWTASAWYLERVFPEKYGKRDILKHEFTIKIQTFQKIVLKILDEIDPKLKIMLLKRMRDYDFDNTEVMDRSFQPRQIEDKTNVIEAEYEEM